jgi:UrcA family protein
MKTLVMIAWSAGLLAATTSAPTPVVAADLFGPTPTSRVSYADLDLTKDGDVAKLDSRIKAAVRRVCRGSSWEVRQIARCHAETHASAKAQATAVVTAARQSQDVQLAAR